MDKREANRTKACPRCRKQIRAHARACPHCGTDFYTLRMRQIGTVLIIALLVAVLATCLRR